MATTQMLTKMKSVVEEELIHVLKDISITYELNFDELCSKYLLPPSSPTPAISDDQEEPKTPTKKKKNPKAIAEVPPAPKKRGRKKKDKDELVKTEEYEYDGVVYLVDEKNNAYNNDVDNPIFLGERLVDGTIKLH